MKLNKVTITGADDSIKPSDLIEISNKYPFVEWGILFSANKLGTPRYPTKEWLQELYSTVKGERINLSAHFCGGYASSILLGTFNALANIGIKMDIFNRYQVNFQASKYNNTIAEFNKLIEKTPMANFIIQANEINQIVVNDLIESKYQNVSFLFDASGGKGLMANEYKKPFDGFLCGYAGGLNPDNLKEELLKMVAAAGESTVWIDTESGVRSNEGKQFDLDKVVAFLEIAKEYVDLRQEPKKNS